jgi:ubiquinone/menaquinone biosynthesis C-methylase UbiE
MVLPPEKTNEQLTAAAFSRQSAVFDKIFSDNPIVQYKRERVRRHVQAHLPSSSHILELNSGTGEDAIWFAQEGYFVHATDISIGMQEVLVEKVKNNGLESQITNELCSFTGLSNLVNKGPYDMIFSNFAGLNCTPDLKVVLQSLKPLLKPGGLVTLVILPSFCLWESLLVFKGKFKTACRRVFSKNGAHARVEGLWFTCWYHNPSVVKAAMADSFEILSVEGLCTLVPPSYIDNFPVKYPKLYRFLQAKEDKLKSKWPWKTIGDYYIISLQKKR